MKNSQGGFYSVRQTQAAAVGGARYSHAILMEVRTRRSQGSRRQNLDVQNMGIYEMHKDSVGELVEERIWISGEVSASQAETRNLLPDTKVGIAARGTREKEERHLRAVTES